MKKAKLDLVRLTLATRRPRVLDATALKAVVGGSTNQNVEGTALPQ